MREGAELRPMELRPRERGILGIEASSWTRLHKGTKCPTCREGRGEKRLVRREWKKAGD